MADTKISALSSGAPAQAGDEYVVARSGSNYKLTLTNIAASMPPIGATTPNTGAFTTLTTSSTVTLNGGTANGVLYLNGSKVATSGTGLAYDGTTLTSNGGFKAAGNASSLAVDGAILDFNANLTRLAAGRAGGNYSSFELYVAGASGVTKRFDALYDTTFRWFDSAGTGELMRLTSTGLGIGTTSPAAKLDIGSGNLTFSSTAQRITGDMSNATFSSRLAFQSSTTNGNTNVTTLPNGTSTSSGIQCYNAADPTNAAFANIGASSSEIQFLSAIRGTGTYLPMTFYTSGSERMRVDTSGNVGIGTASLNAYDKVTVGGTLPSSAGNSIAYIVRGTTPSGTTLDSISFGSVFSTQAASFTLARATHFYAFQSTIGSGSTVTNQYGYFADASMTGATNNYGFYSNIASGSNRWNFYAAGTARNYFAGGVEDSYGNLRKIPQSGSDKTGSYTLATTDVGQFIGVGSGGSITVPNATFATGDVVSIFNNTTGNVTLTMSITTAYIGGTDADKNTITLATRGVATILFISGTVCVVNGNVS